MAKQRQLECRIVITHARDDTRTAILADHLRRPVEVGMYDPHNDRYQALGKHRRSELDRVIGDLKTAIERAGHRLSFCERTQGW